jgi:Fe2+ transport system protein FeoA
MLKSLKDFAIGEKGKIRQVQAEGLLKRRMYDMGITPGATVVMRKVAPFGDPIEITVRGCEVTLRKAEAETVVVEVDA